MINATIGLLCIIPTLRSDAGVSLASKTSLAVSHPERACKFEFDYPEDHGRIPLFIEGMSESDVSEIGRSAECFSDYQNEWSWMPFQRSSFDAKITKVGDEFVVNCYHKERAYFFLQKQTHLGSYRTTDSLVAEKSILARLYEQFGVYSKPTYSKEKGVTICKELHRRRAAVSDIIDFTSEVGNL